MRIGILGGSFNPIHVGHLRLAVEILERLELERLDILPCSIPPHKHTRGLLPFALRAEAISLAVDNATPDSRLQLNTLEQQRQGPSYTVDTLTAYRHLEPDAELHFILGAGDLLALPSWKQGLKLPSMASLAVVPREQHDLQAVASFVAAKWRGAKQLETLDIQGNGVTAAWSFPEKTTLLYLPLPRLDVSSTMLRSLWIEGRSLLGLTPKAVIDLLHANSDMVEALWRQDPTLVAAQPSAE